MGRDQELVIEDLGFDIDEWKSDAPVIVGSITACPRVIVQIQGNQFESLVDTGSNTTCISEAALDRLDQEKIKTLPVTDLFVTGAFGKRSIRVKKQIFMTVHVGEFSVETILLVLPQLCRDVIIGSDWLLLHGAVIDFENKEMHISNYIISNKSYFS